MVDYNKQKKECFLIIGQFVDAKKYNKEDIAFFVMKETGFSEKFTLNFIEKNIKRKLYFIEENGFITPKEDK